MRFQVARNRAVRISSNPSIKQDALKRAPYVKR